MKDSDKLIDAIDAVLPQTQCRLCQYQGCRPYAQAIVEQGEQIDRCLPGGTAVLTQLAQLVHQDPQLYWQTMTEKAKPPLVAVIRESECIGCTKCIQACPVDAIIGASKQMHTIIADACTGCELCVEPCPVDCIDLIPAEKSAIAFKEKSRQRFLDRNQRINQQQQQQQISHHAKKSSSRDNMIQEILARNQNKKSQENISGVWDSPE